MKLSFMLFSDLKAEGYYWDCITSILDIGQHHFEIKFKENLAEAVTFLLFQELHASIQIDRIRKVKSDF